jgi:hypothetical protein
MLPHDVPEPAPARFTGPRGVEDGGVAVVTATRVLGGGHSRREPSDRTASDRTGDQPNALARRSARAERAAAHAAATLTGVPRAATRSERAALTRRAVVLELASASAPPYMTYEWHMIRRLATWDEALGELAACSSRVAAILPSTVLDVVRPDEARATVPRDASLSPAHIALVPPLGHLIAAMPLDNLLVNEAVTLQDAGWQSVRVTRVRPADPDAYADPSRLDDIAVRCGLVAAHADAAQGAAWTFYRATGWGFLYPRAFARAPVTLPDTP